MLLVSAVVGKKSHFGVFHNLWDKVSFEILVKWINIWTNQVWDKGIVLKCITIWINQVWCEGSFSSSKLALKLWAKREENVPMLHQLWSRRKDLKVSCLHQEDFSPNQKWLKICTIRTLLVLTKIEANQGLLLLSLSPHSSHGGFLLAFSVCPKYLYHPRLSGVATSRPSLGFFPGPKTKNPP